MDRKPQGECIALARFQNSSLTASACPVTDYQTGNR